VISYRDAILGKKPIGQKVAIIGAGGIGFDVAELISHNGKSASLDVDTFAREWGIDFKNHPRGGVQGVMPEVEHSGREIYLLQRKSSAVGKELGLTTGWAHRISLKRRDVQMYKTVEYQRIDDHGLYIIIEGVPRLLEVDSVIICAGQESDNRLYVELKGAFDNLHLIGGAELASEIDARRAIDQGCRLAVRI
jgi:2,4-dienoyl-CoA reductase (NADPH2)